MPKLLSPINSFDGAVRVIRAGAEEVYCGVKIPRLKHFELYRGGTCDVQAYDELGRIVKYAHSHDAEVVVTVNRPFAAEVIDKDMKNYIRSCIDEGVDALIVGDLGVLSMVKEIDADIPLYASTYMSTTNYEGVAFLEKLGFSRVVLERQVPIDEIFQIVKRSNIDIEVFIHGSGCSNINVNCYLFHFRFPEMSQALLGIDGLMFPCTLRFDVYDVADEKKKLDDVPILDAYTFCSLCLLPELIGTGVAGFKIVGRCIDEEYQEQTTRIYRDIIDIIRLGQMDIFQEKISSLKKEFIPLPSNLPMLSLQELCCEQKRCYYSSFSHVPYRHPVSWQTWTKLQFKLLKTGE